MFKENCTQYCENCLKLQKALDKIEMIIAIMAKQNILTVPDFNLAQNAEVIIKQCNAGYAQILEVISKTKDGE